MLARTPEEPWIEDAVSRPGDAIVVAAADTVGFNGRDNAPLGGAESELTRASGSKKISLQVTDRVVPDFRGRAVREVAAESASLGLRLDIQGRGVALRQWPAAGTPVTQGSTIRVAFARDAKGVSAGP
jgi:hypothetical protein